MTIILRDIQTAVSDYLNNKVNMTVSPITPASGGSVGPNEEFSFTVTASNASASSQGVALKNVRYRIAVGSGSVAKIKVPSGGSSTDLSGSSVAVGTYVTGLIYNPASGNAADALSAGDSDSVTFHGKAGSGASGGNTTITARILADVDLDLLFPKGEDSSQASRTLTVVG
jgi:hypothetical protein